MEFTNKRVSYRISDKNDTYTFSGNVEKSETDGISINGNFSKVEDNSLVGYVNYHISTNDIVDKNYSTVPETDEPAVADYFNTIIKEAVAKVSETTTETTKTTK